jgi:pimeloyl-ACP methyl ester carboxylesterase
MKTATSADGTTIAYDRTGSGPKVILVGGALSFRKFPNMQELAGLLSARCTVINYDRRGRGDSSEATPFSHATAVEREVEDIAALIAAEGGTASLWGWSSGGALALEAAKAGIGVERVSVYEVPYMVDPTHNRPTPDYAERLDALVAADDRNALVKHFMRNAIGIPAPFVAGMRLMPVWKQLRTTAHTLPYDWEAMGDQRMHGAPLDPSDFQAVTGPAQVVYGSKTSGVLKTGSQALAAVLPDAELRELEGVSHNVKMDVLVPVIADFFAGEREGAAASTLVNA